MGFERRPGGGEDSNVDVLSWKPASIYVGDVDLRKEKRRRGEVKERNQLSKVRIGRKQNERRTRVDPARGTSTASLIRVLRSRAKRS